MSGRVPVLVPVAVDPMLVIVGSSELPVAVAVSPPDPKVDDEARMLTSAVVVGIGEAVAVAVMSEVGTGVASTELVIGKPVEVAFVPRRNAMYSWGRPEG